MNKVDQLNRLLYLDHPSMKFSVDAPLNMRKGHWYVDLELGTQKLTYCWRPRYGFGIWTDMKHVVFGEGPNEVYRNLHQAEERIKELLTGGRRKKQRRERSHATWLIGSLKSREERAAERRSQKKRRTRR